MYIFLDDVRKPSDVTWVEIPRVPNWVIVRDYNDFVNQINYGRRLNKPPEFVSFDHDLGFGKGVPDWKEPDGNLCAKYLVEACLAQHWKLPPYSIHSMNPTGVKRIQETLNDYYRYMRLAR